MFTEISPCNDYQIPHVGATSLMDRTDADGQNRWKTLFGFTTALTTAITDTKASAYFCPAHSDDDYDDEGFRYGDEKETGTKVPASKRG